MWFVPLLTLLSFLWLCSCAPGQCVPSACKVDPVSGALVCPDSSPASLQPGGTIDLKDVAGMGGSDLASPAKRPRLFSRLRLANRRRLFPRLWAPLARRSASRSEAAPEQRRLFRFRERPRQ